MTTTLETTVGQIAAGDPASVRVLEKYGIDFCCGGKVSLSDACLGRGIQPEQLLRELGESASPTPEAGTDWQHASLNALIDHILVRHHAYLKSELPRLAQMLRKVAAAHAARHAGTLVPLQQTFLTLQEELDAHLMKEEMVLFPIVRNLEMAAESGGPAPSSHCGSIRNPIRVMEFEHDSAGHALAHMRALTREYAVPEDACNTYRALFHGLEELEADLHRHIHLENNILFPRASKLQSAAV